MPFIYKFDAGLMQESIQRRAQLFELFLTDSAIWVGIQVSKYLFHIVAVGESGS